MATQIITNPVASVLRSHQGLTPIEIVQDCFETIKAWILPLLEVEKETILGFLQKMGNLYIHQNLSKIDDVVSIGLKQIEEIQKELLQNKEKRR